MNGFKSKADSLKQLIIEHNVDVLVLTETKVYSKSKIRLDGYKVFPAVRKRNGGGRMLVAIKHSLCLSVMIDEGENAEFITICLDFGGVHFRLICIYREHTKSCVLFYTNMNGFKSKADSLKQLIIEHNVDVLVLTETKVYSKSKIRLDGYKVFPAV